MNELFAPPPQRPPTRAAEGLPRWRWTVAEVERIAAAGFFTEYDRFELLGGEIVPMSPKGRRHELVRAELTFRLCELALASGGLMVAAEPQFNLGGDTYVEPDILVHPRAIKTCDVRPEDAVLVIEIADSSLAYDLGTKAPLYAAHGVPEYWVVHAATLRTTLFRQPSGGVYALEQETSPDAALAPVRAPALALSLVTLPLD